MHFLKVDCPPGYHATLGKNEITTCTPCPLGFHQTEAGKTTCDSCRKGFTTGNTGSYKRGQCKGICLDFCRNRGKLCYTADYSFCNFDLLIGLIYFIALGFIIKK